MSLDYDNATDRVNTGSATAIDALFAAGATIMAWVYPRTAGGGTSKGSALQKSTWVLYTNNDTATNTWTFEHGRATTIGRWRMPSSSVSYSTWQHVAVTYDGSATGNDPVMYKDAVAQTLTEMSTPAGALTDDSANQFWIGNQSGGNRHLDGLIGDVRIYNRILSANEISTIYACRGHDGIVEGLVGRWQCDELSPGTTLASNAVARVGSWTTDTNIMTGWTYTPGAGSNRIALVTICTQADSTDPTTVTSATLGGQTLTEVIERHVTIKDGYHGLLWMGYLNEAGIAAMSGSTISITWGNSPTSSAGGTMIGATATYQNIDQTNPISDSSSAENASATSLAPGACTVGTGDLLVYSAYHGFSETHTAAAGYTEQLDIEGGVFSQSLAVAERNTTTSSAAENPSAAWSGSAYALATAAVVMRSVGSGQLPDVSSANNTSSLGGAPTYSDHPLTMRRRV